MARPSSANQVVATQTVVPQLKQYVLTEKLGSGSYATVYKAYKKVPNSRVIDKVISLCFWSLFLIESITHFGTLD